MSDRVFENSYTKYGGRQTSITSWATTVTSPARSQSANSSDQREFVFPDDFPVRSYQQTAARAALKSNCLVCLPTGAGKTLVAAAVIRNFLDWHPNSQAIFVAWTKPLLNQQKEALTRDAGIPSSQSCVINGHTSAKNREEWYSTCRLICATPQSINNDAGKNLINMQRIKLVIVDEAHRALGEHAYCQIISKIKAETADFRIIGLTATPERDKMYEVVKNLHIQDLVYYPAMHPEIKKHLVKIDEVIVKRTETENTCLSLLEEIGDAILTTLKAKNLLSFMNIQTATPFKLREQEKFTKHHPSWKFMYPRFMILCRIVACLVAVRKFGMGKMVDSFDNVIPDKDKEVWKDFKRKAVAKLKQIIFKYKHSGEVCNKLKNLGQELEHYFDTMKNGYDVRALVFVNDRSIVEEIRKYLMENTSANVRASIFVGHGAPTTKLKVTAPKISQKQQLEQLEKFKKGDINVLIATSIGEEGLDISDCNLVVQYDHSNNQTRNAQRSGRTGRKHAGRIIYLMYDKEYECYKKALESEKVLETFMNSLTSQSLEVRKKIWKKKLDYEIHDWPVLSPQPIPQPQYKKLHRPPSPIPEKKTPSRKARTPKKTPKNTPKSTARKTPKKRSVPNNEPGPSRVPDFNIDQGSPLQLIPDATFDEMELDLPDIPTGFVELENNYEIPQINETTNDFNLSGINHLPEADDLINELSGRLSQNSFHSEENYSGALFSTQRTTQTSETSFVGFVRSSPENSLRSSCSFDDGVESVGHAIPSIDSPAQDESSSIPKPELPLSHHGDTPDDLDYKNPFESSSESETEKLSEKESHFTDRESRIETLPLKLRRPDQLLISSDEESDSGINMKPGTSRGTVRFRTPKTKVEDNKENLGVRSCPQNVRVFRLGEKGLDADIPTVHSLMSSDEETENHSSTPEKQKNCKRPRSLVNVKERSFENDPFENTLENTELSDSEDSGPPRNELTHCFVKNIPYLIIYKL